MFYSQFILAKKGPLGTIWIAAHLERKLRKNQVADTDIGVSVDSILFPEVPIALRLSSHLLLGVVRIYSKKVNYLFDDCSEALLKVKQAFRSTAVDLPPEQAKAPYHSITLPETFDLDDFELPDNEIFQGKFVDHHVSTREQITLQDTMGGAAFPTSQFGPDERFGDGDASQIGLDLDEELFMDKKDVAGTSGDVGHQSSTKEASPFERDEHDEGVSDPPLASNANYFSIQAPSTPGLTEEPNLPSAKEEIQVSDDHMDEDQNPCDLAAKGVSGTASSPVEPSKLGGAEPHSNGNLHYMEEQDNEKEKSLKIDSMEFISSGFAEVAPANVYIEAINGQDNVVNILDSSPLEKKEIIAADVQSKECCDVNEVRMDETTVPVAETTIVLEGQDCNPDAGCDKSDHNVTYHPLHDSGAENNKPSIGLAVPVTVEAETSGSKPQNSFQSCINLKNADASESNIEEKLSGFAAPVLKACNSKVANDGADNICDVSNLPAQDGGPSSFGISTYVQAYVMEPTPKTDQLADGVTSAADSKLGGQLDNLSAEESHTEKENNLQLSDFPPPEVLLSMPNLPAGLSDNFLVDSTPAKEVLAKDADATDENVISGRKRSFTEITLTMQSFNSVDSSGGSQSKGTVEYVPDDNDLLSSILVGRRSTAFKMKPTPPVSDTARAKRQRTAGRSVAQKRKVLIDDSTVLHGDTIRQQLTNTEDIRRVRKKAPCTDLEVWVLQKQFLEDEMFSESVFTGMFPALISLDNEAFDLNAIRILRDEINKGASESEISTKPALSEQTEALGTLVSSTGDISARPMLIEETEAVGTLVPSTASGEGLQEHGRSLSETPCEHETTLPVDGCTLQGKATVENEDTEQISLYDVSGDKVDMESDVVRAAIGGEANHFVASRAEPVSSVGHVPEADNAADDTKVDSPSLIKASDAVVSMHIDTLGQLLDQRCFTQSTVGDASTVEEVSVSGFRDQGVDVCVLEKLDPDVRSEDEHLLEIREGIDANVVLGHVQDACSLPDHDSMGPEDRACLPSDQVVGGYHQDELGIANKDVTLDTGLKHDGSCLTSNNVDEHVKSDLSCSLEANLSSQNTTFNEMDGLQYWDTDQKIIMDSTPVPIELIDTGNNTEFGTDAIVHDTGFLNVDDDDVAEDHESDMPDAEGERILDNSGWSARTRAVANYLQVLFEKESDQPKKVISLDSLLVGKSRKEASRMFFETLVLKTKDYIQAEQENSFCDIRIKPRGKLMKSEF